MTPLNPQQENNLTAFLAALSQQDESLPSGLQAQLYAIGQNLDNRLVELPTIAASLPNLNKAYQEALSNGQTGEDEQKATLVSSTNQDSTDELRDRATQIFTDANPVQAAQKHLPQGSGQIASNPLKKLFGRG